MISNNHSRSDVKKMFAKSGDYCIIMINIWIGELELSGIKNENSHKNHRERLRATFRNVGIEGMPDHNILEFILFYSIPRKDTNTCPTS